MIVKNNLIFFDSQINLKKKPNKNQIKYLAEKQILPSNLQMIPSNEGELY